MKAFYINLDRRIDRREQIENELKTLGITAERFPGIETTPGIVGCSSAHHEVLKLARRNNEPYVMVFEDDFQALVPPETFLPTIQRTMNDLAFDFDVLMMSYNLRSGAPYNDGLLKVHEAWTMSGYIVHQRFYDALISLYDRTNPLLEMNPYTTHHLYACDQAWTVLQPTAKWYAFTPRLGKQRASFSDNAQRYVDINV